MNGSWKYRRRAGWLAVLAFCAACGCQTVKTPEEKIASSHIPREFDKVSMPDYVLEAPDLVIVEVLDALPGRPISGERLVRPDGKISLGFYGDVYVAGLTMPEVKEKIILHLRKFLTDEALGLVEIDPATDMPTIDPRPRSPSWSIPRTRPMVFVDVTAYNSKNYYVLGDVLVTGKMPITGNETVLDALQHAGGLMPTAAPQNIRLVRPAPPGACCEQVLAGQPRRHHQRRRPDDQLPAHARRSPHRLSRPDRPADDLHRPARGPVPDGPRHDAARIASLCGPSSCPLSRFRGRSGGRGSRHDSSAASPGTRSQIIG